MPRGNQRGYKGMSGYKGGAKIFDSFLKAGLTVAFGKPKRKPSYQPSYNQLNNSGCLVFISIIIVVTTSLSIIL